MEKVFLAAAISIGCLNSFAQQTDQPTLRNSFPQGVRHFVSQSRELSPIEDAPPPPPEAQQGVVEVIGPAIPIPAPPVSENGDAKDESETKIYTPMLVEEKAFEPQDPFLYRGDTVEPFPVVEPFPLQQQFDSYAPEVVYNSGNSMTCANSHSYCAPVHRRCPNDDCCRLFTAYVAGIFLSRSDPNPQIQFRNPTNPEEAFDASSFDFGLDSGLEVGFTAHKLLNELDLEIRYFSVGDSVATSRDRLRGNITQVNMQTPIDIRSPRDMAARYESSLSNVEANFRYRYGGGWRWTTFIAGFRYLNLNESMNAGFSDPNRVLRTERVSVDVSNDLYGCQIGMDQSLCGDYSYSLEGYWRAGLYHNNSDTRTRVTAATMMPGIFSAQGSGGQSAFVGEIGLKARYALTDSLNFYGSYQILLVDDVAVASRQLAVTDVMARRGHDTEGDVVYHGASFGLEFAY